MSSLYKIRCALEPVTSQQVSKSFYLEKKLQRSLLRNLSLFTVHNALRRASIKRCFTSATSPTGVFPGPSLVRGAMALCQGPRTSKRPALRQLIVAKDGIAHSAGNLVSWFSGKLLKLLPPCFKAKTHQIRFRLRLRLGPRSPAP